MLAYRTVSVVYTVKSFLIRAGSRHSFLSHLGLDNLCYNTLDFWVEVATSTFHTCTFNCWDGGGVQLFKVVFKTLTQLCPNNN